MSRPISLVTVAAAVLAAAACDQDHLTSPSAAEIAGDMPGGGSEDAGAVARDPAAVVATVNLAGGNTISFLDLGGGAIGIAEMAPARAEFVSVSMIERQQATPLEVYLAVRPAGTEVPQRLVRDHERTAMVRSAAPAPRLLGAPTAGGSGLAGTGHGSYTCEPTGVQWVADWKAAFAGITKYRAAAYAHNYSAAYTFYPGAPVYYGTNTNSKTYLGACNGDDEHQLRMDLHRWVGGKWTWFMTAGISGGSKYTFYSAIPARYRAKTYGAGGATVEHYGVGAAWTLSPGETTP